MAFFNPGKNLAGLSKLSFKHQQFDACKLDAAQRYYIDCKTSCLCSGFMFPCEKNVLPESDRCASLKGIKDLACTLCNVSKTKQKLPMINKNQGLLQVSE